MVICPKGKKISHFSNAWKLQKLSDLAVINPQSDVPEKFKYVDLESVKGVSLLYTRDEKRDTAPSRAKRVAQSGDIFFQTVRPYQRNNYYFELTDGNYVFSTGYAQLRTDICSKFLFYAMQKDSFVDEVINNCTGTSYPAINPKKLGQIKVFVPLDVAEQRAIAETISDFDTHINNLSALIEKKKMIRAGALADLVTGKTRLAESSVEWKKSTLGDITNVLRGKRLVRSQLSASNIGKLFPVYQNSLLPLGFHDEFNCPPQSAFVIAAGNAGDVGYSKTAFWAADDCYYFEHEDEIDQKFLYYCFLNRQSEIYTQTRRTSIPRLSKDILEKLEMIVPPLDEQKAIANIITSMDIDIQNLETEQDKMQEIREGVMDDLLTGRVRLKI